MKRKILSVFLALVLVCSFSLVTAVPAGAVEASSVFQSGGDRLVEMLNSDGGWGWPLTGPSADNTLGPIGIGLAETYQQTNDSDHLAALGNVGTFLLTKTNNFTCWDGYLAVQLDSIFGGTPYTDFVKVNFYDKLADGNYIGKEGSYGTESYITAVGFAWDLGIGLVSAVSVGIDETEVDKWITGVKTAIGDLSDPTDPYYPSDLAGGLYGLAYAGVTDFSGGVGGKDMSSVADLADELASLQMPSGVFREGMELAQDTAYALLALNEFDKSAYIDNITRAAAYLENAQLETGGWLNGLESTDDDDKVENNEMTGEALWALAYAPVRVTIGETGFYSIQAAIDAASDGNTINVAAGTYREQVVLNKSLTLTGDRGGVLVAGPGPNAPILDGDLDKNGTPDRGDGFTIPRDTNLSGITVEGFVIQNFGNGDDGKNGVGVGVISWENTSSDVTIRDNRFTKLGYNGIYVGTDSDDMQSNWLVEYNIVEGAPYAGIELTDVTNSQVLYNEITAPTAIFDDPGDAGVGIEIAARARDGPVTTTNVLVKGNTINGAFASGSRAGINLLSRAYASGTTAVLSGITVEDNTITGSGTRGIYMVAESRDGGLSEIENLAITQNTLNGNATGIEVGGSFSSPKANGTYDVATITIGNNSLAGNTGYGLKNLTLVTVDALFNWWGDPSGPEHAAWNPDGAGDKVSANVHYEPWLTRDFETVLDEGIGYYGWAGAYLETGWNILSTPFALDPGDVDHPGCSTWGDFVTFNELPLYGLGGEYVNAYYFDSVEQAWGVVDDDDVLLPCDAIYVRMAEPDIAALLANPVQGAVGSVPTKTLHEGWNLVGLSWMPSDPERYALQADLALKSVEVVGNLTGYTQVVSPWMNQHPWTFVPGMDIADAWDTGDPPPSGYMELAKGYWVFMENGPDDLAGSWFTPMGLPQMP